MVVLLSAEIVLEHAIALSRDLGLSQTVVCVGAGTRVAARGLSIHAAAKGEPALAVGNVVGSKHLRRSRPDRYECDHPSAPRRP